MRFILIFFILLFSSQAFAWDELLRLEETNHKLLLEYDEASSAIRIRHKPASGWGIYKKGIRESIDSPSDVDICLERVIDFLTRELGYETNSSTVLTVTSRIEEFKYLSRKECSALHFDLDGQIANANPIETLLDQVNRIRLAQSPGEDAFRSLLINSFDTPSGAIQLRMVLDREGNFLKFSFAKEQGTLVDFNWEHNDGIIILRSPEKEVLLEIDTSSFANRGGLLVVKSSTSDRFEEESRSFFRLNYNAGNSSGPWSIIPYRTRHFSRSVIRSGVALTTGIADHTPVIQLSDKEIVFNRLSQDEINKLDVLKTLDPSRYSELEQLYNQCMGERLSFSFEEQRFSNESGVDDEAEHSAICFRKTQIEALSLLLGFQNDKNLKHYKKCLQEKNIAASNSSFFSFNRETIKDLAQSDFEEGLLFCYRKEKEESMVSQLRAEIQNAVSFKEILPGEKALELLADQIIKPYRENCLKVINVTKLEQCSNYASYLTENELFTSKVSARLLSMKGLISDSFELGSQVIIEPLARCQELQNQEAANYYRESEDLEQSLLSLNDASLNCAKNSIVEFVSLLDETFFTASLNRAGLDSGMSSTSEDLVEMRNSLRLCWSEFIANENELSSLIEEVDYHLEACLPSVLKNVVAKKLSNELHPLITEYSSFKVIDPEHNVELVRLVEQLIEEELVQWRDIDELSKLRESLLPKVLSLLYSEHISESLNSVPELTDEERLRLERVAARAINASEWSQRREKGQIYFSLQQSDITNNSPIILRESLKQFYLDSSEVISRAQERLDGGHIEDERELSVGVRGRDEFNRCFESYTPNGNESIRLSFLDCEKRRVARIRLYSAVEENEARVSALLPLSSPDANRILVVNQYLGECFVKADEFGSQTLDEFSQSLDNCVDLAQFDISMSLSLAQIESYKEISLLRDERQEQLISCFSRTLVNSSNLSSEEGSSIVGTLKEIRERSPLEGGLLSLIPGAQIDNGSYSLESSNIMKKLIAGSLFESGQARENWMRGLESCEKRVDDIIKAEFREFVMRSIPSLDLVDSEDPNAQLMRDFLDVELVELILEFQKVNEAKLVGNRIQISDSSLNNRLITSDLGMGMLVNFVDLLGELIGKGFIYDEAAMRTELVVFQSELKGFLRWYTTNAEVVSIEEAQDFFQTSKLSEHLSMAVVSEKVYESFLSGISEMRKKELDELFAHKRCFDNESCLSRSEREKYQQINEKYDELRELSREMTSSYDFRRIIRPETSQGREIIEAIRDSYLMPKVIGQRMNARAEESMMNLIGEAILRDNTDGGFAERFVHIMAQSELDKEKDRRWGITEYLWFDDHDFDWEHLKQTDAGLRAIDYYSRFIMLPEAIGRPLGRYEMRLRQEQFRRLITDAQSENTD